MTTSATWGLFPDCSQIIPNSICIIATEFEFGHIGVTGRNAAFESSRKFIEVKASSENAERWRGFVWTISRASGCMTAGTQLPDKVTSAPHITLRLSRQNADHIDSKKPHELHRSIFRESS